MTKTATNDSFGDILSEEIKRLIAKRIENEVREKVRLQFEKEMAEIVASISLQVLHMVSFERIGKEIVIRAKIGD